MGVLSSSTLQNIRNARQNIAPDTPTSPIHVLLEQAMKEPLFMTPPHQQSLNTTESRKKGKSRKIIRLSDKPTNRYTRTSDRSGPTYIPPHNPYLIIPDYHTHEAYNTLPARLRHQNAVEPFDILKLFLTPSIMKSMTCNTNAYAALKITERLQGGGRKWMAVSTPELSIWLGTVV